MFKWMLNLSIHTTIWRSLHTFMASAHHCHIQAFIYTSYCFCNKK